MKTKANNNFHMSSNSRKAFILSSLLVSSFLFSSWEASEAKVTKKGLAITGLVVGGAILGAGLYNKSKKDKAAKNFDSPYQVTPEDANKKGMFRVSEEQEIAIGKQAALETEKKNKVVTDPQVQAYITNLGNKLVKSSARPNIAYSFKVIDSKEVNAFALPGGFIYVYSGLIKNVDTENELVGVLAHEIGHVAGKHGVDQISKSMKAQIGLSLASMVLGKGALNGASMLTQGVFLKFTRDKEREADRLGAATMTSAGWNPEGMITLMQKFEKLSKSGSASFLSSHPSPQERQANISDLINKWSKQGKVDSSEFQSFKKKFV